MAKINLSNTALRCGPDPSHLVEKIAGFQTPAPPLHLSFHLPAERIVLIRFQTGRAMDERCLNLAVN